MGGGCPTLPLGCRPPQMQTPRSCDQWCMLGSQPHPHPPWTEGMTHTCENITFPQLRLRAVNSSRNYLIEPWPVADYLDVFPLYCLITSRLRPEHQKVEPLLPSIYFSFRLWCDLCFATEKIAVIGHRKGFAVHLPQTNSNISPCSYKIRRWSSARIYSKQTRMPICYRHSGQLDRVASVTGWTKYQSNSKNMLNNYKR